MARYFWLMLWVLVAFFCHSTGANATDFYLPVDDSGITLTVTSGWKYPDNDTHHGIDYAGGINCGTPILAAASGIVTIKQGSGCGNTYPNGSVSFGCNLEITHSDGYVTRYSHLCDGSITVSDGSFVVAGDPVALMGTSGYSTGVHLDFRIAPPRCTDWNLSSACLVDPYNIYAGPTSYPDDGTSISETSGNLWVSWPPIPANGSEIEVSSTSLSSSLTALEGADLHDLNPFASYADGAWISTKLGNGTDSFHVWYGGEIEYASDGVSEDVWVKDYQNGLILVHGDSNYAVPMYSNLKDFWSHGPAGYSVTYNCGSSGSWFPNGSTGPSSEFGLPLTSPYYLETENRWQEDFQRGYLTRDPGTGRIYVSCYPYATPGWTSWSGWDDVISAAFAKAYSRNGAGEVVGYAFDHGGGSSMHIWNGVVIQDFTGGKQGNNAIVLNLGNLEATGENSASVIRGAFWDYYQDFDGELYFGAPLGEEMDISLLDGTLYGYDPYCDKNGSNWVSSEERTNCILEFCGTRNNYTSMQRFQEVTLCYAEHVIACDPLTNNPACPGVYQSNTGNAASVPTALPAFSYSSLDLMSEAAVAVDYIDLATSPRGYVNPLNGEYRVVFTGRDGNIYEVQSTAQGKVGTWEARTLSAYYWVPYVLESIGQYPFLDEYLGDAYTLFTGEDCNIWVMITDGVSGGITSLNLGSRVWIPCANYTSDPVGYVDLFTEDFYAVYVDSSQGLESLRLDVDIGAWSRQSLSSLTGLYVYPGTDAKAFQDQFSGMHYMLFTGTDKRIKLLSSVDGTSWNSLDLSSQAAVDYSISTPTGFIDPESGELFTYLVGQNRRVYELKSSGNVWVSQDLSALTSVPYAYSGTGVSAGYNAIRGEYYVTFLGENRRVNQFRKVNGTWTSLDLTSQASVTYAQPGTTPETFVDPFTGGETTLFTGDGNNARIQVMRYAP